MSLCVVTCIPIVRGLGWFRFSAPAVAFLSRHRAIMAKWAQFICGFDASNVIQLRA